MFRRRFQIREGKRRAFGRGLFFAWEKTEISKKNYDKRYKGKTIISRKSCKRLRYLLFEVAMSLVAKNKELYHYHTTRKLNPLKKMQSLMAVVAKLLRVFFIMLMKEV